MNPVPGQAKGSTAALPTSKLFSQLWKHYLPRGSGWKTWHCRLADKTWKEHTTCRTSTNSKWSSSELTSARAAVTSVCLTTLKSARLLNSVTAEACSCCISLIAQPLLQPHQLRESHPPQMWEREDRDHGEGRPCRCHPGATTASPAFPLLFTASPAQWGGRVGGGAGAFSVCFPPWKQLALLWLWLLSGLICGEAVTGGKFDLYWNAENFASLL